MRANYVRIDFKNCDTPYDYTICEWCDVDAQMLIAEPAIVDADRAEVDYQEPQIIITPCFMTESEFDKWFKECVEDNA